MAPAVNGYVANPAFSGPQQGDPAAAKKMLEAAGVKLPYPINFTYPTSDTADKQAAALKEGDTALAQEKQEPLVSDRPDLVEAVWALGPDCAPEVRASLLEGSRDDQQVLHRLPANQVLLNDPFGVGVDLGARNDPAVGVPAHPNAAGARAQAAVVLDYLRTH